MPLHRPVLLALALLLAAGSTALAQRPAAAVHPAHQAEAAAAGHAARRHGGRWTAVRVGATKEGDHRIEVRAANPFRRALGSAARGTVVVGADDLVVRSQVSPGVARAVVLGAPKRLWNSRAIVQLRSSKKLQAALVTIGAGWLATYLGVPPELAMSVSSAVTLGVLGVQEAASNQRLRAVADEIAAAEVNGAVPAAALRGGPEAVRAIIGVESTEAAGDGRARVVERARERRAAELRKKLGV